jgi:hypothetical protein
MLQFDHPRLVREVGQQPIQLGLRQMFRVAQAQALRSGVHHLEPWVSGHGIDGGSARWCEIHHMATRAGL